MSEERWQDLGPVEVMARRPLAHLTVDSTPIALAFKDGRFSAVSGVCNHVGGPLGEGRLEGDYIVCPWHNWTFHCRTGAGGPGYEGQELPRYETKIEAGRLLLNLAPLGKRQKPPHQPHPLARKVVRADGPTRVAGLSTTVMDVRNPRYSGSDDLLTHALRHAETLGAETRLIRLTELAFRACEGYYSKSALACTWPCSITQMDAADQMDQVYEALVHWADVVLLATPIRWGAASSLYYKMVERLNCVQNQITTRNRVLIRNKVAALIIVGGQDNVQAVAGQMLAFLGEIGFLFPQFPFVAHSRGWTAEDMEQNVEFLRTNLDLRAGVEALAGRAVELSRSLLSGAGTPDQIARGGRKAHDMTAE